MHPQLMLLLEIQDLYLQRTDLLEEPGVERVEADHFHLDLEKAAAALERKIEELKDRLAPGVRMRCERGFPTLGRMVVPVIDGVCYGCFVSIPTARTGDFNQTLRTCESCGRFIYLID
jgi:predicted  nucleic acid-binding Zn-ribbon protein